MPDFTTLPKVVLHDHLDGGLRPHTLVDLAADAGHELPATDPQALGQWFAAAANSGSLERYLETFDHTIAVMQTADALRRVAREFVVDLAADGVVYAEARWAPEQHLAGGLTLAETVEAVRDGLAEGMAEARSLDGPGRFIEARQLVTGMRHTQRSAEIAELAVAYRHDSVAGFDIAGGEIGNPPSQHLAAFNYLRAHHCCYTIHAGEAIGVESISEALGVCGAMRIGHGVRLIDDITGPASDLQLSDLAAFIRDRGVPLELCVTSNVQTGAVATVSDHPIDTFLQLGFAVTVNCDNRLMGDTTMSAEFALLAEAFGWGLDEFELVTLTALDAAFVSLPVRDQLAQVISDGYAAQR